MSVQALGRGLVVVVEDDRTLREVTSDLLSEHGFEVRTAGNGKEAMSVLEANDIEAVLSDVMMPDMDGLAFLRAVRERDLDVPVVLMSGARDLETSLQAMEYGALAYLLKPFRREDLIAAVEKAVRMNRLARVRRAALSHSGPNEPLGDRTAQEAAFSRALRSAWMAYQPIVRAGDHGVFAHEALLRSRDEAFPHPGALFSAAERLGRVHELGRVVRGLVAADLAGHAAGIVFVNLHAHELADESLFHASGLLAQRAPCVVLEITERASLEGIPDLRSRIATLRRLGYRIAVDDLGAGYAGLTTFATIEPDIVKLDMALIRNVDLETVKQRLVASMVALCKESGITVVAEGVETEAESSVLTDLGCDLLQGYLYGRPAAALKAARTE